LRENFDRFKSVIHKEKEMADFRRCFLALAVLVLIIGSVAPASAQVQTSFACVANAAVPPTLRAEGLTELTGDIVLNCSGGTPTPTGTAIPTANITVFLTNPITSRITSTSTPPTTEALLLVDEPTAANQRVCTAPTNPTTTCANTGTGGASFATSTTNFNVYQGILTGPNAVTFLGVPIDAPTTPGAPARVYRITNIRANVTTSPATCVGVCQVQAFISASGSTSMPINNPTPIVGFISKGLNATATLAGANGFLQCQNTNTKVADLVFTENFATAFKVRDASGGMQNVPGTIYNTESGFINPGDLTGVGLADNGTRLKAVFSNLPQGVTLTVPTMVTDGVGGTIVLIGSTDYTADASVTAPFATAVASGVLPITYSNTTGNTGSATAVYEVIAANALAIDSFDVPVMLTFTGAPGTPGTPTITGTGPAPSVILSFAPTPSGGGFTLTTGGSAQAEPVPIPRFIDNVTSTNIFTVSLCQTILLFPYVTDYPGFDTGIAIANTSMDPLATAGLGSASPQTGACSVTFFGGVVNPSTGAFTDTAANLNGTSGSYGTTAANTFTTGMVGPGQTWAFSVAGIDSTFGTTGFQGFVGYAIAVCNFQYAHGYSFVSDYGLRNFAAAYLALVIPDTARTPTPNICSISSPNNCLPSGEQLVH
jgi:hypothetical protein